MLTFCYLLRRSFCYLLLPSATCCYLLSVSKVVIAVLVMEELKGGGGEVVKMSFSKVLADVLVMEAMEGGGEEVKTSRYVHRGR